MENFANTLKSMQNSYVLISAATSDIGREISMKISKWSKVVIHGRNMEKLDELSKEIGEEKALIWCYDLSDVENIRANLIAFQSTNGITISSFVHCAGIVKILPFKNFRLDYVHKIFDINFFSAFEISKTLLLKTNVKALKSIVFISAIFSKFGNKGNAGYVASKGALDSLTKTLATELAPDVRVNSVLPGGLRTRMTKDLFEDQGFMDEFNKRYLLGEGECADIASMVNYLISDESKWITGQHFIVDGGFSSHL